MRLTPRSLFGRLTLILVLGVLAAQLIAFWLHLREAPMLARPGPHGPPFPGPFVVHLVLTVSAVLAVSLLAVRLATRPLQHLAEAADAFGRDLDAPPLPEDGPEEVRRAAEAFNRMQDRLRRLIDERSRALAAVSHDLRTPLTRLRLRADLVEDDALRAQLESDIEDMRTMIEATLDYLRGLRDAEPVQIIDVEALLQSIVADQQALGRAVTLGRVDALPYPGRLSALKRAVANLVDNAVQYGHEARVSAIDAPDTLRIAVEDGGPGIPEADLRRVVEPYVRLDTSRSRATGGVGLGLAIAGDAARLHGGTLQLLNRPEGGLRATLELSRSGAFALPQTNPKRDGAASKRGLN